MSTSRRSTHGRAFTLVEILVVIGIIVVLAGILVPLVGRSMRQAKQVRTAADLQSIATALEAFKNDHGDYPRTEVPGTGAPLPPNAGAAILGRYLNGPLGDGVVISGTTASNDPKDPAPFAAGTAYQPGDVVQDGGGARFVCLRATDQAPPAVGPPPLWLATGDATTSWLHDFVDGPGLRIAAGRKKVGPYFGDNNKVRGIVLVDTNGSQILYFPGGRGKINVTQTVGVYVNRVSNANPALGGGLAPSKATIKYDADDNFEAFRRDDEGTNDVLPLHRIRAMLGDYNGDGTVDTSIGEKVVTEAPYLLWAAGTDGKFGPDADFTAPPDQITVTDVDKCDDVVSFKQ